ncbi:MAG: hypothetical protein WAM14_21350, partial [Candidatus Nitrosopolaris sp.]
PKELNLNNDVNNTIEKNENPSVIPVKSSVPSDPSASLNSNDKNKSTINANIGVDPDIPTGKEQDRRII